MKRRFTASNRHWVFAKQNILAPLNDQLVHRHGAEYVFEVPESSFDWDVEFSSIKDRSGNTLREQYMAAWVQPSLVAPGDKIYQLGVKVNWRNPDAFAKAGIKGQSQFDQNEVAALMAKVDGILGSPIKDSQKEVVVKEEKSVAKPTSITNQEVPEGEKLTLSSVDRVIKIANELSQPQEVAKEIFNCIGVVNNAKKLDSVNAQQLEVQDAYDRLDDLKMEKSTALSAFVGEMLCNQVRKGSPEDVDIYDILSRLVRQISDSIILLGKTPDYKLQAVNEIETSIMNLFQDDTINTKIEGFYRGYNKSQIIKYLEDAYKQLDALKEMALNINLSDIPAPQVVENYVEEIKENLSS
jgi:hypothetical protein